MCCVGSTAIPPPGSTSSCPGAGPSCWHLLSWRPTMKITQTLRSGIALQQDFRDSVRFVMFETGLEGWEYATHGGTAFVVNFHGKLFGLTCRHCFGDFDWRQLSLTE